MPKVGGTKDVNLAKLRRLAPTHVLVNVDENRRETVEALRAWAAAPEIVVTHPLRPGGQPGADRPAGDGLRRPRPSVAARADALQAALARELAATRPEGRPAQQVLYLIWRDPWMTVARDTYISRMLARIGWHTLPAVEGGAAGAARYPALAGDEPWLGERRAGAAQLRALRLRARATSPRPQALCPGRGCSWSTASCSAGTAPAPSPAWRYLRDAGRRQSASRPRLSASVRHRRRWTS